MTYKKCPECHGQGYKSNLRCETCKGKRVVTEQDIINSEIG